MKEQSKFRQNEQQDSLQQQRTENTGARDFASVEEMLRFDAAQNLVSPNVERKLKQSVAKERPSATLWQRILQTLRGE